MDRSKADRKKRSPDGLSLPNQNTKIINIRSVYYKICRKFNEQKKMDVKNEKSSTLPSKQE